ncbi:TetR family transcriptional regulator [soil metagenome]
MTSTRDKLLSATTDALRAGGIATLSARTIADRAGVNQALVFYHFGTMSDLVQAATIASVDASLGHYRARFAEVGSLSELLTLGRVLHEHERELGNVAVMAQLMAGAQHEPLLAEAGRYAMARWSEEIEGVVRRVLAGSPLLEVVDATGLAQAISAGFIGLELYDGVDPVGGRAALDALEGLGTLVEVMDDLGAVATRALRSRLRKSRGQQR